MHKHDRDRVVFYSARDMSSGHHLSKCEHILTRESSEPIKNINDALELHNIKLYIDSGVKLTTWLPDQLNTFKERVAEYGKTVGKFISKIDDSNFLIYHEDLLYEYIESFWELISKQKAFKNISDDQIKQILRKNPRQITEILKNKGLVERYNVTIRDFLVDYPRSAEIILSIYEIEKGFFQNTLYLPESLTKVDKETIISKYIDYSDCNTNYLPIIQNSKKQANFSISDKTRLKAKRKREVENNKFFENNPNVSLFKYGVSIRYIENTTKNKDHVTQDHITHCTYSIDYIKSIKDPYVFYLNFKFLFEYVDEQNRICLVSKQSALGLLERLIGVRSKNQYHCGFSYNLLEMLSQAQIHTYSRILLTLQCPLEKVLQHVYNIVFAQKYGYAQNAMIIMPTENSTALEKVRLIAPELESILKQYKLFVEDNEIDFELLQISSAPSSIKEIPSLIEKKYVYINKKIQMLYIHQNYFSPISQCWHMLNHLRIAIIKLSMSY